MSTVAGQVGIGGVVTAFVAAVMWAILTGRLVPRRTLLDVMQERDDWKTVALETGSALSEERAQKRELLEVAHVTEHVLTSLPRPGGVGHGAAGTSETTPR